MEEDGTTEMKSKHHPYGCHSPSITVATIRDIVARTKKLSSDIAAMTCYQHGVRIHNNERAGCHSAKQYERRLEVNETSTRGPSPQKTCSDRARLGLGLLSQVAPLFRS